MCCCVPLCVTDLNAGQLLNDIFRVVRQRLLFVFPSLESVFHPDLLIFLPLNLLEEKTYLIEYNCTIGENGHCFTATLTFSCRALFAALAPGMAKPASQPIAAKMLLNILLKLKFRPDQYQQYLPK